VHLAVEVGRLLAWLGGRLGLDCFLLGCLLVFEGALGAFSRVVVDIGGLREVAEDLVRDDAVLRRVVRS